jgi:hypothetical protein
LSEANIPQADPELDQLPCSAEVLASEIQESLVRKYRLPQKISISH